MKNIIFILVLFSGFVYGQDYTKGKQLFNTHCAACHKMDKKLVGPALNTIVDRQGKEWTKEWIYNNNALRESGDEYAIQIWEEYNKAAMPGYQFLKDEELDDIVEYLAQWQTKKDEAAATIVAPVVSDSGQVVVQSQPTPTYIWIILIIAGIITSVAIYAFYVGMSTIVHLVTKTTSTNTMLMKKQGISSDDLEKEFDSLVEERASKEIKEKVKILKKDLNDKLKRFK